MAGSEASGSTLRGSRRTVFWASLRERHAVLRAGAAFVGAAGSTVSVDGPFAGIASVDSPSSTLEAEPCGWGVGIGGATVGTTGFATVAAGAAGAAGAMGTAGADDGGAKAFFGAEAAFGGCAGCVLSRSLKR